MAKGRTLAILLVVAATSLSIAAQRPTATPAKAVMWEPVDIKSRDLYFGPGGREMVPDLRGAQLLGRQPGGNNLKYRLRDRKGDEWVAKIADESQPETAAVRLLWAIGYKSEINYLVPKLNLGSNRPFSNVRLEARPRSVMRIDRWMWNDNPFIGTKEFEGLKIMMALMNNWDLKDDNNVILIADGERQFTISDLGATFGRLANTSSSRSGRNVGNPGDYAKSAFIRGVNNGVIDFAYVAGADYLLKGIKVENGRWLANLLLQLSDQQIRDAFRAANYSEQEVTTYATAVKARIQALDRATRGLPSTR